ncbi:MAG: amidohydrolase family protein [Methanosarcinales archaeon]|nr:amidohydrolase family protein [ANME-2 cluster archaeon]MDF1532685.1 amidohydrolase family protein [ANME-2 cluster archaeon]MDW7774787.1 amidohydrolase family protein [Methanosarcinales archaeon]
MSRILIKNGYVITMDGPPIRDGIVLIEDNKITYVGKEPQQAEQVIDAKGCVVMPGLVNAHNHAGMTLFRGYADDLPLKEWLEGHIWPAEAKLTGEDVYYGTLLACLEMIRSGTTAFADMYFFMDHAARAVEESGLRASLSHGMIELFNKAKGDADLKEGIRFANTWNNAADGRITTMYGPHAPNTCSREFLAKVGIQAEADAIGMHIHVLETKAELLEMKEKYSMCSIHLLDELGILGPGVLAAHCVWLSAGDMDILAERGVNIVHCPVSNMKLASGIAPVPELFSRDANVALGTDGCASNNSLDMFGEMKTAALLHKVNSTDPTVLPAHQVLKMATVNGAKALKIPAGQLKPGMLADIIIVDMQKPHLLPNNDLESHLVYAARGSDVRTTIVDGKVLMKDGIITSLDEKNIMEQTANSVEKLIQRVKEQSN